jgi:hypothetical protein
MKEELNIREMGKEHPDGDSSESGVSLTPDSELQALLDAS